MNLAKPTRYELFDLCEKQRETIDNHIKSLEKRVKRLEKMVILAIISNLPQLLEIIL